MVALAEMVDVSVQSISAYENERSSPGPGVVSKIASTLNLPEHFFTLPERRYERGAIFYRSMSSTTKTARSRAEQRFAWLRDMVHYLSTFVSLPESNVPALSLPADPLLLSDDDIEDAADVVRRYWRLGEAPIANMVLLLENQGAIIARDLLGADTLDSLSEFVEHDARPYIVVGTDRGTPARWRFDVAHELGHMVLHAHVDPRLLTQAGHHKRIEQQAHRFAAAFLLPLAPFGEDLFAVNLDTLRTLKPKWKASIATMIMRARHGGFLTEDGERRLWINMSRRGWRRIEPYDDTMAAEEPRLLRRAFELTLNEGDQTPDDVVSTLGLSRSDVEALAGLPSGYLAGFARVSMLTHRPSERVVGPTETPAEVIRMPVRRRER